jgi:hypothetical protein
MQAGLLTSILHSVYTIQGTYHISSFTDHREVYEATYSVTDARALRVDAIRREGIFTCHRHSAVFRSDENMWSTRVCVHILASTYYTHVVVLRSTTYQQ